MRKIVRSSNNGQNRLPVDLVKANETVLILRQSGSSMCKKKKNAQILDSVFVSHCVQSVETELCTLR